MRVRALLPVGVFLLASLSAAQLDAPKLEAALRAKLARTDPSDHRRLDGPTMGHTAPNDPFVGGARLLGPDGALVLNPQFEWAGGGYFPGYLTEMESVYDAFGVAIQYDTDQNRGLIRNRRKYLLEPAALVQAARDKRTGLTNRVARPAVRLESETLRGSLLFGPRGLQQTHPRRRLERLNPVANLQLGIDVRQVEVHRSFRDEELVRRLLAAVAFGDEAEHFHFSSGQADRAFRYFGSIHHHEPPLVSIPVHPQDSFHTHPHF